MSTTSPIGDGGQILSLKRPPHPMAAHLKQIRLTAELLSSQGPERLNLIQTHWCVDNEGVTRSWERPSNSPHQGTGFLGGVWMRTPAPTQHEPPSIIQILLAQIIADHYGPGQPGESFSTEGISNVHIFKPKAPMSERVADTRKQWGAFLSTCSSSEVALLVRKGFGGRPNICLHLLCKRASLRKPGGSNIVKQMSSNLSLLVWDPGSDRDQWSLLQKQHQNPSALPARERLQRAAIM
ncbi:hypothetical protein JOB18_044850 [Solea senegalensis]|uniref:Uncharacterized protein n=1 Tax=Solea senegalensis TaxID=28829 RepID=A0AAV6S6P3_SOLSE|nr:hypothetical protein JOB18_044850 [Solea senegalensis]